MRSHASLQPKDDRPEPPANHERSIELGEGTMIQPLKDRVLLERLPDKEHIIVLADLVILRRCKVIAVGPGKRDEDGDLIPMEVRPGDIVLLPGVAAEYPDFEEGKQIFVREDDIGFYEGQRAN